VKGPFSIEHELETVSSEFVQLKFAIPSPFGSSGFSVSVGAVGGVVSTVQVREAEPLLTFPAGSLASTEIMWLPSLRPEKLAGFVQAA
jgi:hypothetical protein